VAAEYTFYDHRFFRDGAMLRSALFEVYEELGREFRQRTKAVWYFTTLDSQADWQILNAEMSLEEAFKQLDDVGAAPEAVISWLTRDRIADPGSSSSLTFGAEWAGSKGFELEVKYRSEVESNVQYFRPLIQRTLTRFGRAEPFESQDDKAPQVERWWNSQWFAAVVGASLGSGLTYVLPEIFG
jgi:hypothetical protein